MTTRTWSTLLLLAATGAAADPDPRVTFHRAPRARAAGAVDADWPSFGGPTHDFHCAETRLSSGFPAGGPPKVWTFRSGEGYAAPAVAGDRLVFAHRTGDHEEVVCLRRQTGARLWSVRSAVRYRDRFGYGNGPRASPVIDGDRVYSYGVTCVLQCLELTTGRRLWRRDLAVEHRLRQGYFGNATTPLIDGERLIVNVGAPGGPCVVALDKRDGKPLWRAGTRWGASYASPIPATLHGRRRILVFAGGESDPPHGGLLVLEPATGRIETRFAWRSKSATSVNAANPVVVGNRVFVSAAYNTGGAQLALAADGGHQVTWTASRFGTHWNTALHHDGQLYGIDGRHMKSSALVCVDWASGRERWRNRLRWAEGDARRGIYRASLLRVDGRFLCLGEKGDLLWLDLTPAGARIRARARLFDAEQTWTPPVVSRGLLYVCQNVRGADGSAPRLICYDLRGD